LIHLIDFLVLSNKCGNALSANQAQVILKNLFLNSTISQLFLKI